jgi:LAO/AO transport system kinase
LSAAPERYAELFDRFGQRQRAALARAISVVENERPEFQGLLHAVLAGAAGHERAARVGITGPPGAGKSTLLSALAGGYREADEEVGVVAVDPTSPYSGGALLGDRIRLNDLATDRGIFIRSMATRGSLGGLATTTKEVIDLMDAFGFPRLLVETVGVGQTELEVTGATDTVVVVLVPESGDSIQAMKAGLMEIADIFVVNKSDRPGADRLSTEIKQALHLRAGRAMRDVPAHHGVDLSRVGSPAADPERDVESERRGPRRWVKPEGWQIPVLKTIAQTGEGVEELADAIESHRTHLIESGEMEERRRDRAGRRIRDVVSREMARRVWNAEPVQRRLADGIEAIQSEAETPYSVSRAILRRALRDDLV